MPFGGAGPLFGTLLARELEICYANISLNTDYDVGVVGEIAEVTHEEVIRVFQENIGRFVRNEPLRNVVDKQKGY